MERAFGQRMRAGGVVDGLRGEGLLGRKNGRGFYRYEGGEEKGVEPVVAKKYFGRPVGRPLMPKRSGRGLCT